MISEVLTQHPWLWPLAWQSTACLTAGLAGSVLLRRHPARAHQLLLLSLIAAILIPALSHTVRQNQWGLFVAERTVAIHEAQPFIAPPDLATAAPAPTSDAAADPTRPAAIPGTPAPAGARFRWDVVLPVLWLGAGLILLLRLIARLLLGLRLVRQSEPVEGRLIAEALDAAKAKFGIERDAEVRVSSHARSPVIWCWGRRPVLLVPGDSCDDTRLDWPSVICHELAHWKRHDHLSALLAELMICLLPWQPFSWLTRRRLVDLSEEVCDDWVIASGQVGTRYARTLLSLTALGPAALIPAVVTTKTGLAARIRRIIEDKCGNPRSGLRWTLTVAALTACLAVTIAFAQTRLAQATAMVKSIVDNGACVEQPASAVMIRGRVLDPNDEPLGGQPVHVVALPMACYAVEPNAQGYFEVPWSPIWLSEGPNACLLVQERYKNLTGMVEVQDPASPVTIRLEHGLTFQGRMLDSNSQPIPKSVVIVFLDDPLQPQTPIAAGDINGQGEFRINALPRNHAYRLRFRAQDHVTKTAILTAAETGKDTIDVGTVLLEPQDPAKPIADDWPPSTEWRKSFDMTYRLEKGEVVKLMKPPFMLEHQDYMIDMCLKDGGFDTLLVNAWYICGGFRWDGQLQRSTWYGGRRLPRIRSVLNWVLRIPDYDFVVPEELRETPFPKGDWIVRDGSSVEEKLKALEEIIRTELHRSIRFERRTVERDTIVVTGRYTFTSLPDKDPNRLCLFVNKEVSLSKGEHNGQANSLAELLRQLADGINVAIDDRTEPVQTGKIQYLQGDDLMNTYEERAIDKEKDLPALLDNLARQTSLQFKVEKQPAEVWFATEKASS